MEKLERKIVGYLPYRLEVIGKTHKEKWTLESLNINGTCKLGGSSYDSDIYDVLPILRPLSDLAKEIEVNGEKFVPIVVIAKMFGFGDLEKFELDDDVIEYGWVEHYMDDSQPYSFGYFQNGEFGTWYDDIDDSHPIQVHCKMEVIEWLYEHHFDLHGLIEKCLAIDINTLK